MVFAKYKSWKGIKLRTNKLLIIILTFFLFFIVMIGLLSFYTSTNNHFVYKNLLIPSPSESYKVYISPIPRQYNIHDWYYDRQPYPSELIQIPDQELEAMICSPQYVNRDNNFVLIDSNVIAKQTLTAPLVLHTIHALARAYPVIDQVNYCYTKDNTYYLIFQAKMFNPPDAKISNAKYISFIDVFSEKFISGVTTINTNQPQLQTIKLLQISTDNIGYVSTLNRESSNIYKIGFPLHTSTEIYHCLKKVDNNETHASCKSNINLLGS